MEAEEVGPFSDLRNKLCRKLLNIRQLHTIQHLVFNPAFQEADCQQHSDACRTEDHERVLKQFREIRQDRCQQSGWPFLTC